MPGFIKIHRGWSDDEVFRNEPFCERAAWIWLVEHAVWREAVRYNHKGEMIDLKRAQIHVSLKSLTTAFGWSQKKVRGFLDRLEKGHKAVVERAQSGTIITICDYEKYSGHQTGKGHSQGKAKVEAEARSGHTQKEYQENNKEKEEHAAGLRGTVSAREEEINPLESAIADCRQDERTSGVRKALRKQLGAHIYDQWFESTTLTVSDQGELVIISPSRFSSSWVETQYSDKLAKLAQKHLSEGFRGLKFGTKGIFVPPDPGIHPAIVSDGNKAEAPVQKRSGRPITRRTD